MAQRLSASFMGMKDTMGIRRPKSTAERKSEEEAQEEIALQSFKDRITTYRNSFNPYQRTAPGFDYVNWKPHGVSRDEDHSHTYAMTCRGLAPYVRDVVIAASAGIEERKWESMTYEGQIRIQEQVSRAASRETLLHN